MVKLSAVAVVVTEHSVLDHRSMVSDELWARLTKRIQLDYGVTPEQASLIMDQALAFLKLAAENPGNGYSPSPEVDKGWHTFILYTREYAAFCETFAGGFIHHEPTDMEGVEYEGAGIARTVAAMKVRGIRVEDSLWEASADCGTYCRDSSGSGGQDNGNGG